MSNPLMSIMGNAMGNNPMMQNNPIMQMISMLKNGNNPQMKQIMDTVSGKSQQEMNEYIKNAAQQRGVDLGQLAKSIGMPPEIAEKYNIKMSE